MKGNGGRVDLGERGGGGWLGGMKGREMVVGMYCIREELERKKEKLFVFFKCFFVWEVVLGIIWVLRGISEGRYLMLCF